MNYSSTTIPLWLRQLDETDLHFIKRMVLASGSLKQLAQEYEVSYPTIRQRLDRVIGRIRQADNHPDDDAFESRVRQLVADNELPPRVARDLLDLHRAAAEQNLQAPNNGKENTHD